MDDLVQCPGAVYWDKPVNFWTGCRPVSQACDHCYARTLMEGRFGKSFEPTRTKKTDVPTKGVCFVGNMCDQFGEWVSVEENMELFSRLFHHEKGRGPVPNDATYLFCTKRVHNMADAIMNYTEIPNAYFGFTAENQEWFDRRSEAALEIPERHKLWISAEPLLGPIELKGPICDRLKFVAVGCESGPRRRPCKIDWIEGIVEQCRKANIPVFVKQVCLRNNKFTRDINEFPENIRIRQVPWKTRENK